MVDNMGQGKIPWYRHRLMHRKRVTCELHDSYFRLMTIKHAIPKIEWAIELLYNSVKTGSQWVGDQVTWWQDVVEKANRKLSPGPLAEHQENEKDTTLMALRVGVNMLQFCSVSNSLSHTQPFQIKWEVYFFKEVFPRLLSLRLLLLQYVFCMYMGIYVI